MTKLQLIVVSLSGFLLLGLFFGFNKRPAKQSLIEKSRVLEAESTDISVLLNDAKAEISEQEKNTFLFLEQSIQDASTEDEKIQFLEQLSGEWFKAGNPAISGHYAEQIASIRQTEEAWSIAGTTYAIGVQRSQVEKVKSYCSQRAVQAFENAISLNPKEISHTVNLALCYTDYPPKDNPMKGVLMLVDLNKKNPDNVLVLTNLARLAIKTGQNEKAAERLERVIELDPDNTKAHCMIVGVYESLANSTKAKQAQIKCKTLSEN